MSKNIFINENKTLVVGILNVTPDSFSDGGSYEGTEAAVKAALDMVRDGAYIIDVGGESTRPGYTRISDEEEIKRVVPVIEGIRRKSDVMISVDTYKYEVARAAFNAGADILNDIWGLKADERLAGLVADEIKKEGLKNDVGAEDRKLKNNGNINKKGICLMHNRKELREDEGENFLLNVCDELMESFDMAIRAGIPSDRILLDPGIGFGKSYEQNLYLISHIDELIDETNRRLKKINTDVQGDDNSEMQMTSDGLPFMMAASRKSVIGLSLDVPVSERDDATIAISVYSAMKGCSAVRVHDVLRNVRALAMLSALKK